MVLRTWICADSMASPVASVMVPVSAPVVMPCAEAAWDDRPRSARTAVRPMSVRILVMKTLWEEMEGCQKLECRGPVQQERFVTAKSRADSGIHQLDVARKKRARPLN